MTIRLQINGEDRDAGEAVSVADLLQDLDLAVERVAVEHNRRVLKRDELARVMLADGDQLEIIQFVGGG
jgi:thiamine biosynthesis protein ThiS